MPAPRPPIGAHISVAGGLAKALTRLDAVGATAAQVFVANPRAWAPPAADPDGDAAFAAACAVPVYVHAPYLINFGSPTAQTTERSAEALAFSLRRGAAIGARGVVVHAGSAVAGHRRDEALEQTRTAILRVLDGVRDAPPLLIEPTAGGGAALASDAVSTAEYLARFDGDERLGLCLDTCHMHAAGHDLRDADSVARAVRAYAKAGPVRLLHVNDSRDPAGSKRDRHASLGSGTIGGGTIGADALAALFRSPTTRRLPMIVETDDSNHAGDIATLHRLHASTERR